MKANNTDALILDSVQFSYPRSGTHSVFDISLSVYKDEIFVLAGESGSGKTTLLRLIAGFESPARGRILYREKIFSDSRIHIPVEKRNVGYVSQDVALFPHLTVAQNVEFGLSRLKANERRKEALRLLSLVRLETYADRYPHQISGGQIQRCALVRMLAPKPDILLLDEPFGNLDNQLKHDLLLELRTLLLGLHVTTICVTHDSEEIFLLGDRAAIIRKGRLEQCDKVEALFSKPVTRYVARYLGKENIFIPRRLFPQETDATKESKKSKQTFAYSTPFGIIYDPSLSLSCTPEEEFLVRPHHLQLTPTNDKRNLSDLARVLSVRFAGFFHAILLESLNPIYRGAHFEVFCTHKLSSTRVGSLVKISLISKDYLQKINRY